MTVNVDSILDDVLATMMLHPMASMREALIECTRKHERELIASWVADMCQGLDANTIAEAIRNGGNDAMDNFKVSK